MKNYFLLFISTILLLFSMPRHGSTESSIPGMEHGMLKKACSSRRLLKRTCIKGCVKHQTHSEQQSTAGVVIDCSQSFHAILTPLQQQASPLSLVNALGEVQLLTKKLLSPFLAVEPDPPRYS